MSEPMIEVRHLTKRYAGCTAVADVSFTVAKGEVVGFLGPNGAGKTTTLRMLACYLPASQGEARVVGFDVFRHSLEVRRRIGYLPESTPLYPEMRVDEYLQFRARLKGLPARRRRERVGEVKELCGLTDVGHRIVGQLSKGYRQRVGLADALVHDPELVILDEPTIGLDPNQIRHVRDLIKSLAPRHTVLLSTHILAEVELTCQRVLIINRGQIVAADTPDKLRTRLQGGREVVAEIRGSKSEIAPQLYQLPGVARVTADAAGEWTQFRVECSGHEDIRQLLFEAAARNGWSLRELRQEKQSLEDIFAALTRGEQEPT
ncbi:MAG: ATP-binding cassette domain-containing protein [Kiritimatiellaeota bacterium]|nr:ATP-binding cassette domain-containing protein [Kiritimatiellota bacterium]